MENNEKFLCDIINFGANCEGVGNTQDGKIAFIPYSIKGEKVIAKAVKVKKSYIECELEEINHSSKFRIKPKCPYFAKCGGCQLQHLEYLESLKVKQGLVQNAINKIGKLNIAVLPTIASNLYYGYRNKASLPFNYKTKKLAMHDINNNLIDVDDCVIVGSWCKKLIDITNDFVRKFSISVYNPTKNTGLLKQLMARKIGSSLLITLVINGKYLPNFEDYFSMLLTEFENVGLSININTKSSNYLPIGKFKYLCGEKVIELNEYGVRYTINNACFLQVNSYIKQKIYESVLEEVKSFDLAIDCYSGAGLLTALISKQVKKAIGVEIVEQAVLEANKLCEFNNILNVENICGDSSLVLSDIKSEIMNNKSVIVLDPPRKGCDKSLLNTLNEVCVQKIIYISCDPATLSRDLNILCNGSNSKYKVNFIRPYDMFPQTKHVETVVSLSLKK